MLSFYTVCAIAIFIYICWYGANDKEVKEWGFWWQSVYLLLALVSSVVWPVMITVAMVRHGRVAK